MNYSQSVDYLYALGNEVLTAKYRLENIEILLERLGNPQKNFPSVIIAGTNGKGSVAAMLESIARQAGHRTALYTSPHLITIEERVRVCGEPISQYEFAKFASLIRDASEQLVAENRLANLPTFFEQITAIALTYFNEAGVELAFLEVGLGGRLDATNAAERIVSVIASIDFDHQEILGDSIEKIAAEKAAIIKSGARAVIGRQLFPEAIKVLWQRCAEVGVDPVFAAQIKDLKVIDFGRTFFRYRTHQGNEYVVEAGLRGRHQADNAALAIEACEAISQAGVAIPREAIISGLSKVVWEGRLEFITGNPALLLDGAHNRAGARVLKDFLRENWQGSVTMVFAAMDDKDIEGMSAELFPLADKIILTSVDEKRGASEARLRGSETISQGEVAYYPEVEKAFARAQAITPSNGLICVAGSLYLVGAIKRLLKG
jgi:dihydrofolate synthase / folylpolyglutamate synthase